jgi:cysteine-rich repeat protein
MRTRLISNRPLRHGLTLARLLPAHATPAIRRRIRLALPILCLLLAATPALAVFHLMKVVEVYTGSVAAPNAHYVVLQMYTGGQNIVAGHPITVYDAAGNVIATSTFPGNVPNGANQARILIATPEAQAFFGITADLSMSAAMMRAGGKVCFDTIDCVAWGAYTGPSAGVGTPFNASGGIPPGRAAARRLDITGSPTTLEGGDDTNNCAADFVSAIPIPRNNAGASGAPPASTCGNGAIEALEQCDDGNTNSGDGCSSTCMIDTPVASLSIGNVSVSEGNSGTKLMNFIVRLSQASPSPVRYNIATANGTASAGSDYVARSLVDETIPAGQTSRAFAVTLNGDLGKEADETLLVNVSSVRGATVADAQGQGTIVNDDNPMLSIGDISLSEGNSGTRQAVFTVKLSQASPSTVTYSVATADSTAKAGSDYVASALSGQAIAAGQTSRTFSVTVNGDTAYEANESFTANLTAATVSISDGLGRATILNDDLYTLTVGDVAIAEGNSGTRLATFTVRLSQARTIPVTYTIATANVTALAGSDYVARTLSDTIPAGQTSRVFSVTINGNTTVEPNETFAVNLSGATGASILDSRAIGTIRNDDGPTLSVNDVAVSEGNSGSKPATFTIRLSQPSANAVTYRITTANGTATAASGDYATRTLNDTIPAGATTRVFSVMVNGNTTVEPNETFTVNLGSVAGATVLDGQGLGTIVNDDGPTLSVNDVSTVEGDTGSHLVTFTVRLSQAAAVPVRYNAATSDGTAVAGSDYVARRLNGETIPAGQTSRIFQVTVNGDTTVEPNQSFRVNLGSATGATVFDGVAAGTIVNDDP